MRRSATTLAQAYALADAEATHAWKGGPLEGDSCTINGKPGTLVKEGDELVCRPYGSRDAQSARDELERAYQLRETEDANAWRGPADSEKWW